MEELSIEEKAAHYDAALEYAHCLIEQCKEGTCGSFHRADLDKMFPELRESEDERIRKWIIGVLSTYEHDRDLRDAAIAWLERQCSQILANSAKTCKDEQKPEVDQHSLPVSDDSSLPTFDEDVFHPCAENAYEQKPAWSEEDNNTLLDTINILRSCGRCSTDRKLWLLSLKDRVQPQPKQANRITRTIKA